jgi:hypothetical protein
MVFCLNPSHNFTARLLLWPLVSFRAISYTSAKLHLASSPNTFRKTRMRGRKKELTKIADTYVKIIWKIKSVHHLLWIEEASYAIFVHLTLRKKIIQRCRRMRLDTLSTFSYVAYELKPRISVLTIRQILNNFRFFLSRLYGMD